MNLLIVLGLVAVVGLGYWLFIYNRQPKEQAEDNEYTATIDELRKTGIKIKVEYDECQVRDYSYSEEVSKPQLGRYDRYDAAFNILSGNEMKNVDIVAVNRVVLTYHHTDTMTGDKREFTSGVMSMDKDSLAMSFIAYDVFLYIDPKDQEKYFFEFVVRK